MECLFGADIIDIVKDPVYGADYIKDEDPKLYISNKTNRGPLVDSWLEEYWNEVSIIIDASMWEAVAKMGSQQQHVILSNVVI